MRKASKWFFAILLFVEVAGANAGNQCETLFQVSNAVEIATADFISKVETRRQTLESTGLLGRTYDFQDSLALLAHLLPPTERAAFLAKAALSFATTDVVTVDRAKSRGLRYRSRFLEFAVDRSKVAKVAWTAARIETQTDLDRLVEDTIAIYTEAQFTPIRRHTIYARGKSAFIQKNIEAMQTKLLYEMFTLGDREPPAPGAFSTVLRQTRRILGTLLPMQFSTIRGLHLTQAHVDAFNRGGPQELYRYIRHREGLPLAIRYWMHHLTNAKVVILLAYAAFLAPSALEAWDYFAKYQSFETSDQAKFETAKTLYKAIKSPPAEIIAKIRDDAREMPTEERDAFLQALKDLPAHE